jgi:LuxR family maltose regulon positive regulatory protein
MSDSLILTKLYIPPIRRAIVPRPALIARLNEGLATSRKLTLISAPAGFGKTTLISEWVIESKIPTAWLSLDEEDNDLIRFLGYFIAALRTITPTIGEGVLVPLQSPQPPPMESILSTLINEISTVPKSFTFVFDDYHDIDSKPVDRALTFLIEHLPEQMRLVITTREDPDLPLSRLRARDQLTELRAVDLQFSQAEAAEFLNQVMGLNLSIEDVAALESRTEGWIAGLQLAALSMQGRSDTTSFIQSFAGSHRFVLDYLVEEVLKRQPENIRHFLLKTAILDRLSASLCDAVTGREDGKELLETLERGNLFLIPLDDQRQWYRYHPLFAEVVLAHLSDEQSAQVSALHRQASVWYERNDLATDAIRHALAAKDFERAATLIELAVPEMRRNRQGATVTELGWLKALPDELVRFRPVLCVDYAYALVGGGELEAVEARLQDAERWLDMIRDTRGQPKASAAGMVVVDEEQFRRLPGMIALLRAAQALARGDINETVKNARRALDLAPEDAHLMLGGAASQLGLAAWTSGDLETAHRMTAEAMTHLRLAGYNFATIGCSITLADIQLVQGRLREAMTTYEQALQWATKPGAPVLRGAADMHVGMSSLYYEHNDLEIATQHLLTSQALGELAGMPQNPYRWCAAKARILVAQGDLDGALDQLDQAERLYDGNFSPNVRPIATRKVRLWVTQGRLEDALGWVREQKLSVNDDLCYMREFDHITLARVLLTSYLSDREDFSISEVMGMLERLLKAAKERGGMGSVVEILILQAIAYHAQGHLPAALMSLQQALTLAEPQSYVRIFLDEGPSMMELLREAAACGIMLGYTGKLLAAFESEKIKSVDKPELSFALPEGHRRSPRPAGERGDGEPLIEPLSQRELDVLKLLRSDLSGPEIALQLSVSINTFRTHTKNIFIKLGVNDRRAAVRRAEELDLF